MRAFRAQWPGVQLELIEATGDVQLEALERGDIDAGLLLHSPGQVPPGLAHLCVAREPLVLALPEHHALAAVNVPLDWTALLEAPLVIFPRRSLASLYDAIVALYYAAGCTPRVAQEAIQMQTIVNLVSAGLGVAWVPASVRQFQRQGVVYRDMANHAAVPWCETSLVWRSGHDVPALARWTEFVRAATAVHSP